MPQRQSVSNIEPVRSLSGEMLTSPAMSEETKTRLEADLATAQVTYNAVPNEENTIWLGRIRLHRSRSGIEQVNQKENTL